MALVEQDRTAADYKTPGPNAKRDAFLKKARSRFKAVSEAEMIVRAEMLDDLKFRASDQWPAAIRQQRERDGRPCLTTNRLPQIIRQITNQQRENKPAPIVSPVDSAADQKTAEVFQGMIRHIEQRSAAQVAYNTASDCQATMGRGYIRILTDYESETDFNQSLLIRRVRNPFMIYMDPSCQELDYSDASYAFVMCDLTLDQYNERFGDIEPASLNDFASIGDDRRFWVEDQTIRVAEYWYVELQDDTLVELASGDTILLSVVPPEYVMKQGRRPVAIVDVNTGVQIPISRSRPTQKRVVKWATISGIAVLDGNDTLDAGRDWPGKWIPIIPVIGDEIDINGQVDLRGVVRDAKDPIRNFNYWVSAATEAAALAPKAPFVAADGQIEGYEEQWAQANVRNFSVLTYKAVALEGHLVGPPQRNSASADISSMMTGLQVADNNIKAVTGFYDASLGQAGPEQSGKAILARQQQGDKGSYNYQDNMALAISTLGRYLVDLIPKVYDAPRIMRILGEDGQSKTVMVHAGQPPTEQPQSDVEGIFDLGAGSYDVTVSVGPSYQAKRQEASATMTQFVQAYPPAFPIVGDILVRNMDWPGKDQIADRLAKALPPELKEPKTGPDGQPIEAAPPPEMVQQMQAMDAQLKQAMQELDEAKRVLAGKQIEGQTNQQIAQMEIASREKIAMLNAEIDRLKIQATLEQKATDPKHDAARDIAVVGAAERERIATIQADKDLEATQMKIDGALDLASVKTQMAEFTARQDREAARSRPVGKVEP